MLKKITLSALLLTTALSFSQATLEHSYISDASYGLFINSFYAANGLNYYTFNRTSKNVIIYNENHVQIKSFILPMDATSVLDEIFFITDTLFNNDNSFEFVYSVTPQSSGSYNILLCNDDGVILQTFADKHYANLRKNSIGNYKLILNKDDYMSSYTVHFIDVYSLSGTLSTDQQQIYSKNISFAYPNPSNDVINILNKSSNNQNSTLEIFNFEGKKILEKKVMNDNQPIKLDISLFSSGIYIYKLNGEINKFIKE